MTSHPEQYNQPQLVPEQTVEQVAPHTQLAGHGQELWHDIATQLHEAELNGLGTNRHNPYALPTHEADQPSTVHPLVSRLPTGLPVPGQGEYTPDAIIYTSGQNMVETLELYGAADAIVTTEADRPQVDITKLPERLQDAILIANMYEAVTLSQDKEHKQVATERNSQVRVEDLSALGTLHHSTKIGALPTILHGGLTSIRHTDKGGVSFKDGGNVNFASSEVGFVQGTHASDHARNLEKLAYSWHNGGEIYLHVARPAGCYREHEEIDGYERAKLIAGGLPSTEISAITVRSGVQEEAAVQRVRDQIVANGMFIPIFKNNGEQVYSRSDYDTDLAAVESGTYLTQAEHEQSIMVQQQAAAERQAATVLAEEARAAIKQGISLDEYRSQQQAARDAYFAKHAVNGSIM